MNKILLLFLIILTSCTANNASTAVKKVSGNTRNTKLITLTVDGESHEFVSYNYSKWENGIAHWPGCKYCKNVSKE